MKKLYSIVIALLFITQLGLNAQTLLAEYPLVEDGVDATGKNTDMTISKASFQNDGIYSNGIYYGSDTTGSYISTPQIEGFNFDDLTIKVDFFIDEYPENNIPIIMAGTSWRWLSAWLDGDKIALKVNNGIFYVVSDVVIPLNQWQTVSISYSKAEGEAKLYLGSTLVVTIEVEEITNGGNARLVNSDGGIGKAYKGYWKNLKVYDAASVANIEANLMDNVSIKPLGNQIQIVVPFTSGDVNLQMFDMSGRNIGEFNLNQGKTFLNTPKGNNIIMFVLTDNKGNRLARKHALNN